MKNFLLLLIKVLKKHWIFVVFVCVSIAVVFFDITWKSKLLFLVYSFMIYWLLTQALKQRFDNEIFEWKLKIKLKKIIIVLLVVSILILLLTRLIPFLHFGEGPLGYDSGFYIYSFKNLTVSKALEALNAFEFVALPFKVIGVPPIILFYSIHILSQLLIAFALYLIFKSFRIQRNFRFAIVSMFLFSVSAVQFLGYWWAFGKQMMALSFLLLTVAFFLRQSPWMLLTACVTLLIHTATAIPLVLAFALYFIFYFAQLFFKKRYFNYRLTLIFFACFVLSLLIFYVKADKLSSQLNFITQFGGLLSNVPQWRVAEAIGLFINLEYFHNLILIIVPFCLFSILNPKIWLQKQFDKTIFFKYHFIIYLLFFILMILTVLPVIYQARFSIMFSLLLIIVAVPAFTLLIEHLWKNKSGKLLLCIYFIVFASRIFHLSWNEQPLVYNHEIQEIKSLNQVLENNATVMGTYSNYTPWLHGFVDRSVVGPGYLGDTWSFNTWQEFWGGADNEEKLKVLRTRPSHLYIHVGERQPQNMPFEQFIKEDNEHFTQITPHVWKFNR